MKKKILGRGKIKISIRKKIFGTIDQPRLTVFRSNKNIYAQLIVDTESKTIVSASSKSIANKDEIPKIEQAKQVGLLVAQKAQSAGVKKIVFDRDGYLYHGRIKHLADGAREGGLLF